MIEAFINAFGGYPTQPQLERWVRGNGQSLSAERAGGESFIDVRAHVIARRAAAGQTTPRCPPNKKLLVSEGAPAPPALGPPLSRNTWGTKDDIIEGLVLALDEFGPGENLTQKKLSDLSTGNPDIPAPSRVNRKGTLVELRERAVRLRASRMQP